MAEYRSKVTVASCERRGRASRPTIDLVLGYLLLFGAIAQNKVVSRVRLVLRQQLLA
jgi:hypothetical protein